MGHRAPESISQAVVKSLMDFSRASRILQTSFIDDVACQIKDGDGPDLRPSLSGYDGAVQNILLTHYRCAAAGGDSRARDVVSIIEASIWASGAANRASESTMREMLSLERTFERQREQRRLG